MLNEELDNAIDTSEVDHKWKPDPKGYFTIKPFHSRKKVFVRYYDSNNNRVMTFSGTSTTKLVNEIIRRGIVSTLDHAAYLGKEIERAVTALHTGEEYVQG